MPQTEYNLHLKGYAGGYDFDRNYVDYVLAHRIIKCIEPENTDNKQRHP